MNQDPTVLLTIDLDSIISTSDGSSAHAASIVIFRHVHLSYGDMALAYDFADEILELLPTTIRRNLGVSAGPLTIHSSNRHDLPQRE